MKASWIAWSFLIFASTVCAAPQRNYSLAAELNFNRYLPEKEKNVHITKVRDEGLRLLGLRRLNDYFSLQMHFNIMGEAKIDSAYSALFNSTVMSYGFNGVFHVPVYFWNPFFKLGIHHWELSYRNPAAPNIPIAGDNLFYGFGFQFNMTPYAAILLEAERYEINNMAIHANAVGVMLRF